MMTNPSKFNGAALPSYGDKSRFESDRSQLWHEVVQLSERCLIYHRPRWKGMNAYICFNSGMHRT